LSNYGGAFPKILKPFLLCVGGPIGNGRQNFSWISLIDTINALDYVLHTSNTGIYNFVAPQIITNDDLTKQISTIWHRPHLFKLSSSMIKLLFGQMGQELFLNNLIVAPKKLITEKFNYHYPDIQSCLTAIKTGMF
jgi:NAD dependent epimerase/dehydratase family enzyme